MHHTQNKNRLLGRGARYFLMAVVLLCVSGAIFFMAYRAGMQAPRTQTQLSIDPAIEKAFFSLFTNVHTPESYARFPALDYTDMQGNTRRLRVGRGEFLLLNIWATWCPPCLIELPDLEKLQAHLPDHSTVRVMAISVDQTYDQAGLADFLAQRGLWQAAAQHDAQGIIMRNAPIRGLPTSFLLAEDGEILYIFEGAAPWAAPTSRAFFNALPQR